MRNLTIILLMLFSFNMYAQVSTDIINQKIVQLDTIELVGIRVTKQTPVTAKTITNKEIKVIYSGQELPILLNRTPSITSYSDAGTPQGYTYFRLRGIDQTRINMTLNGVPLNEPEDQGVYFSNYPNFAKNIKSLQIQRGVGTSTNGVSSFAGSINFSSPFGVHEKNELEVEYGSFNTSRVNYMHESGLSKNQRWSTFVNLSFFNTDGYKYHSGSKGYSGFIGVGYYGDTSTFKLTAFSGGSTNQMSWYAVSESDLEKDKRTNYNHEDADDNFTQTLIMLEYKQRFSSISSLSVTAFYNKLDGEWDLYVGDMLNFGLGSNFYGLISNFNYTPNDFNINVGVSGNKYNRNHSMIIFPDSSTDIYNNTGFKNEFSSYGKMEWNKKLFTLFADLQVRFVEFKYDGDVDLETQNWNFFNPKAGATFNVTNKAKIYGSVGQSHREPTRSDMFGGEDNLIEFLNLSPEEVIDYEFGYRLATSTFRLDVNLFYMDFKNELTLLGALGSYSLPQFTSVNKSYRSGLEIDTHWELHKEITLKYNGTFSDNKIQHEGIEFEPLYTPKVIQNIALNLHKDGMFIELGVQHRSKSYIDFENEHTTPAFTTFGMIVGYENQNFRVKFQGMNLGSADYYTNGYVENGESHYYVNAPASGYVTVTYKF